MSHTPIRTLVDPLFYESLSGTFKIETDVRTYTKSLGRLVLEALDKGEQLRSFVNDRYSKYYYRPAWAPRIATEVTCIDDIVQPVTEVSEISLITPSIKFKFINTGIQFPGLPGAAIEFGDKRRSYNIHSADAMERARDEFSFVAQSLLTEAAENQLIENI